MAENTTGYFGVVLDKSCKTKPFQARVTRGGKMVYLGSFATAEEAALCIARLPERNVAAERAAAVERAAAAALPMSEEQVTARRAVLARSEAQRLEMCKRARDAD